MGLTKQYLRYVPGPVLGLVGGQKSNVVFLDIKGVKGKYCAVGACENVLVWDLRTGEKVQDQCVHLTMKTHYTIHPSCVILKWNCPSVLSRVQKQNLKAELHRIRELHHLLCILLKGRQVNLHHPTVVFRFHFGGHLGDGYACPLF